MKLTEASRIMDQDEFYKYTICQSKASYDDESVAEHYAEKIRARSLAGESRAPAPNMRTYRCKFDFEGVHYHLTRGKR